MSIPPSIEDHFGSIADPRRDQGKRHQLLDIISIAICASICGADNWVEVAEYGRSKEDWFQSFLSLPHGIPSHDTFGEVFSRIDPEAFRGSFRSWTVGIAQLTAAEVVAIDGKVVRGSKDGLLGRKAIDMVSAWASRAALVLGQVKTADYSNEITAIPTLLDLLVLHGCIVTIDAIGCQAEIADKILERGGDYLLRVKANQGQLHEDLADVFAGCDEVSFKDVPHDYHRTVNKGHGRIEIRQCWTLQDRVYRDYLRTSEQWSQLTTLVRVQRERRIGEKIERQIAYYISSWSGTAQHHLEATRHHWHIENKLHWVLDVAFREDHCRVRKDYGPENFALLRHLTLTLLKRETSANVGIKAKRLKAGWDNRYLLRILQS
jgi:predicted transposase YbfD/YdcC